MRRASTMVGSPRLTMDVETAAAIDRLSDRIDHLEVSLRSEMVSMRDALRGEMVGTREELRVEMVGMRDELRSEFRAGLAENRRHAEILVESVRDDIRLVAEGVAHLAVKLDRQQR